MKTLVLLTVILFPMILVAQQTQTEQSVEQTTDEVQPLATAYCVDESIGPVQLPQIKPNEYGYDFKFSLGASKTKVQVIMRGQCSVKVTRKCATEEEIIGKCPKLSLIPELEEKKGDEGNNRGGYSLYQIEHNGTCQVDAFPAKIYIAYYGKHEEVINTKATRTRMIHVKSAEVCEDTTTEFHSSQDDPKPGGDEDGYSDFFLANVYGAMLPDDTRIDAEISKLESDVSDPTLITVAKGKFTAMRNQPDNVQARAHKKDAKKALMDFAIATSGTASKNEWFKRALRIRFQIEESGRKRGISAD